MLWCSACMRLLIIMYVHACVRACGRACVYARAACVRMCVCLASLLDSRKFPGLFLCLSFGKVLLCILSPGATYVSICSMAMATLVLRCAGFAGDGYLLASWHRC